MTNLEKLKSEICSYLEESSKNLSRQGLHKFIDTLPGDLFVSKPSGGYKIYIEPKEDKAAFKDFMISCGFGNDAGFWSNAGMYENGFLFDTSASMICEFIVKDALKRRYSVVLDDIALDEDNIKRVILDNVSSARYKVTVNFDATLDDVIESASANSAPYDYRAKVQGKAISSLLGLKEDEKIVNLVYTRGDIPSVTGQVDSGKYTISYPMHLKATIHVESEDSDKYVIFKKALETLKSCVGKSEVTLSKPTLENIEKDA